MAGIHTPFLASIWTTCANMIGAVGGMYLMFKVLGRRGMMLYGCVASALCMLAPAIAYSVGPGTEATGKAIIAFGILYAVFYTGLSGIISWPIASEMVSSRLRVPTVSFATGINYFFSCKSYILSISRRMFLRKLLTQRRVGLLLLTVLYQLHGSQLGCKVLLYLGRLQPHNVCLLLLHAPRSQGAFSGRDRRTLSK